MSDGVSHAGIVRQLSVALQMAIWWRARHDLAEFFVQYAGDKSGVRGSRPGHHRHFCRATEMKPIVSQRRSRPLALPLGISRDTLPGVSLVRVQPATKAASSLIRPGVAAGVEPRRSCGLASASA